MGYVGNQQTEGFSKIPPKQDLTGATGSTLTLSHAVSSPESIDLFINNVRQEPTESYTTDGTTVNLVGYSVAATDDIYVVYNSLAQQTSTHPSNQALQATSGTFSSTLAVTGATTATGGLNVGTIKESTGTTTAMTIDSDGHILTPQRPAFFASLALTTPFTSISGGIDLTQYLTSIDYNIGNHYSAADGFVAPIDGIYHFSCGFYYYSAADGELQAFKNGTVWQRLSNSSLGANRNPFSAQASFTMQLVADDEIKLKFTSFTDASMFNGNRNTFFSGFLVG